MDFKHKELINIKDGKRLRLCSRCLCRFTKWNHNIYNGCKKENRYKCNKSFIKGEYICFSFERECRKKDYITKNNQKRTGYTVREKYEYDVICKMEL